MMEVQANALPLIWEETQKLSKLIRRQAIQQFINIFREEKERYDEHFYWGDEIEYMIVKLDDEMKTAKVCLKQGELLKNLQLYESYSSGKYPASWMPEMTAFMVEGIPGKPYGGCLAEVCLAEENMRHRKKTMQSILEENEVSFCLASFPRLGEGRFCVPEPQILNHYDNMVPRSVFISDEIYSNEHPRYRTIVRNIRLRRGSNIEIQIPVFKDTKTRLPSFEDVDKVFNDANNSLAHNQNIIFMDSTAFGGGCCALQVTIQASGIHEARILYDQLAVMSPLMIALSAASPIYKGCMSDIDARWPVFMQSVDDRTKQERESKNGTNGKHYKCITRPRCDSIRSYLTPMNECFNDEEVVFDTDAFQELENAGVDSALAKYIAHLLKQDPLVLYEDDLRSNDGKDRKHFENILTTNWQTVRFKTPTSDGKMGWRVEFRPMEVQLSSFENAAYSVFIVLLTRVIIAYGLTLSIPISKIDENMTASYRRDAVNRDSFYYKRNIFTGKGTDKNESGYEEGQQLDCQVMSVNEIFNGNDTFIGLVPLVRTYVNNMEATDAVRKRKTDYLQLISDRASDVEPTTASIIREFVRSHSDYKDDSVVSDIINYDLLKYLMNRTEDFE